MQVLKCSCGAYRRLAYERHTIIRKGITLTFEGMALLVCDTCGAKEVPTPVEPYVREALETAKARKLRGGVLEFPSPAPTPTRVGQRPIPFDVDFNDFYLIPGLYRPSDDGFLTPVLFDINVLHRYTTDPRYSIRIPSGGLGTIWFEDEWCIPFGITASEKVVMWLGDIERLPDKEQHYLYSHNLPPDHDIGGDFYEAQIEAHFTEPSAEQELLMVRDQADSAFAAKYAMRLFRMDEEAVKHAMRIRRPVNFTPDQLCRVITALNKVLIEATDADALRTALDSIGSPYEPKWGTNKLVQALLGASLGQEAAAKMLAPFFVVYDWRTICDHLVSEAKAKELLQSCATRMGVTMTSPDDERSLKDLYQAVVSGCAETLRALAIALS